MEYEENNFNGIKDINDKIKVVVNGALGKMGTSVVEAVNN